MKHLRLEYKFSIMELKDNIYTCDCGVVSKHKNYFRSKSHINTKKHIEWVKSNGNNNVCNTCDVLLEYNEEEDKYICNQCDTCPICYELYNDNRKKINICDNNHPLCYNCYKQVYLKPFSFNNLNSCRCPICREYCIINTPKIELKDYTLPCKGFVLLQLFFLEKYYNLDLSLTTYNILEGMLIKLEFFKNDNTLMKQVYFENLDEFMDFSLEVIKTSKYLESRFFSTFLGWEKFHKNIMSFIYEC